MDVIAVNSTDCRDGRRAAFDEAPRAAVGMRRPVAGGDDEEAALPARLGQDLDRLVRGGCQFDGGGRPAGQLRDTGDGRAVDSVKDVQAARRARFLIAGMVICDVSSTTGTLVFDPSRPEYNGSLLEWPFRQK